MITVLCVGGTGESYAGDTRTEVPKGSMLSYITAQLPADRFTAKWVGYPADYGLKLAFADSVLAGEEALLAAILAADGPVVLLGYSQGAAIAGNVAAQLKEWAHVTDVRGVGLIADPYRSRDQYQPHPYIPEGFGICGERFIDADFPV